MELVALATLKMPVVLAISYKLANTIIKQADDEFLFFFINFYFYSRDITQCVRNINPSSVKRS